LAVSVGNGEIEIHGHVTILTASRRSGACRPSLPRLSAVDSLMSRSTRGAALCLDAVHHANAEARASAEVEGKNAPRRPRAPTNGVTS